MGLSACTHTLLEKEPTLWTAFIQRRHLKLIAWYGYAFIRYCNLNPTVLNTRYYPSVCDPTVLNTRYYPSVCDLLPNHTPVQLWCPSSARSVPSMDQFGTLFCLLFTVCYNWALPGLCLSYITGRLFYRVECLRVFGNRLSAIYGVSSSVVGFSLILVWLCVYGVL